MASRTQKRNSSSRHIFVRVMSIFLALLIVGGTFASLLQLF
jgi:hypothetical protein